MQEVSTCDSIQCMNVMFIGSVWFLLGFQYHRISGGTALQCHWETSLSLRTESHGLLS